MGNYEQWLEVDLGRVKRVTGLATQGRQNTDEFVSKFGIKFSVDADAWTIYKNPSGVYEVL